MIGTVHVQHHNWKGELVSDETLTNLVVTIGKAATAGLINGVTVAHFNAIAIGSGSTAPAAGDVDMETEIEAKLATLSRTTTTVTDDTAVWVATFTAATTQTVREASIFLTGFATSGQMLSRVATSTHVMSSGDTLTITWNIKIA